MQQLDDALAHSVPRSAARNFPAFFQAYPETRIRLNVIYLRWDSNISGSGGLVFDE